MSDTKSFGEAVAILEAHYYTDAELALWLQSKQPQLDGATPLEALAAGRKAEVIAIVERLEGGVYI